MQRDKYKRYLEKADDRALSDTELAAAKGRFQDVEFRYYGLLIRLARLYPNPKLREILSSADVYLTHKHSPAKKLSQQVLVLYKK